MTHTSTPAKAALSAIGGAVLLGPLAALLAIGLVISPALTATSCDTSDTVQVGTVPGSLTATAADGTTITLNRVQLERAATIIQVATATPGAGVRAARIGLMAALTESSLRMLANTTNVPASGAYPNDGDGADHDSLGLFQMRPSTGWGTVADLMNATYQARAFIGGPGGPNHGSPAGLLDIPDWTSLTDGEAAQAVEVSAFPDRYQNYGPVASRIITTLTKPTAATGSSGPVTAGAVVVFPLPAGTWTVTDRFGPRIDPITGQPGFHHGVDLAAPAGTPVLSATGGRVTTADMVEGTGTITILTIINGAPVAVTYLHMTAAGILVHAGQEVSAGEQIGAVGSTGHSTGPHLHFQVQPGGLTAAPVDPLTWLRTHHARALTAATSTAASTSTCTAGT